MRIEVKDGPESRSEISNLLELVYPPEVLSTKVWRNVQSATSARRVILYDPADTVVSTVGIHFREASIDGQPTSIAGIGGVMTHPSYRKLGYGRAAMLAAHRVISETSSEFGLLFCEPDVLCFYRSLGWLDFKGRVRVEQNGSTVEYGLMRALVMGFHGNDPKGNEIDLRGLPW